jgi:hypothetical protein
MRQNLLVLSSFATKLGAIRFTAHLLKEARDYLFMIAKFEQVYPKEGRQNLPVARKWRLS